MLSRKTETTGDHKQTLFFVGLVGSFLFLLLLAFLVANLAGSESLEKLALTGQAVEGDILQPMRMFLADQTQVMGIPLAEGSHAYWYIARAGGVVSYLLLWLATCWGIMMSSKVMKGYMNFAMAFALHEFLPVLGIVFAALHALVLLGDSYIDFDIWQLLVPFSSSYKPFWTGLGSLAFYLFLALIISSYLRKQMGQKNWRAFHYMSYLAFLFSLLHGLMAGTDNGTQPMRLLYLLTGGVSLFLVYYRLLALVPKNR